MCGVLFNGYREGSCDTSQTLGDQYPVDLLVPAFSRSSKRYSSFGLCSDTSRHNAFLQDKHIAQNLRRCQRQSTIGGQGLSTS